MDFSTYYRGNATYIEHDSRRLRAIVDIVARLGTDRVLDVGCGTGWLTAALAERSGASTVGLDILPESGGGSWHYVVGDLTRRLPFRDDVFGCVVAGEVIEHLPDPDALLREIHRVLEPDGWLVLSTPNLVSWANRVLVPLGVQPLGTETSSVVSLGRRFRVLGQGHRVQGHLKVFTHRALDEILERYGFAVTERHGMPAEFPFPVSLIDRFFTRYAAFASDLLYVARAEPGHPKPADPADYDPGQPRWQRRRTRRRVSHP